MALEVIPIPAKKETGKFDLFCTIYDAIKRNNLKLKDGDVLVISSKYASYSQGRIIALDGIMPSQDAKTLAKKYQLKPKMAEAILRESDHVFGGMTGFVITSSDNIMAPNAGIDKSNVQDDYLILYPEDPYHMVQELKRKFLLDASVQVGIILVDSRLMPARVGTSGVAIACAGIEPTKDMRAKNDLDGNPLKVTFQAIADNLAAIANQQMGEGSESMPIAIVRNSSAVLTDRTIDPSEMAVSHKQCVYMRGLQNTI